jgi:hypothetical protein
MLNFYKDPPVLNFYKHSPEPFILDIINSNCIFNKITIDMYISIGIVEIMKIIDINCNCILCEILFNEKYFKYGYNMMNFLSIISKFKTINIIKLSNFYGFPYSYLSKIKKELDRLLLFHEVCPVPKHYLCNVIKTENIYKKIYYIRQLFYDCLDLIIPIMIIVLKHDIEDIANSTLDSKIEDDYKNKFKNRLQIKHDYIKMEVEPMIINEKIDSYLIDFDYSDIINIDNREYKKNTKEMNIYLCQ